MKQTIVNIDTSGWSVNLKMPIRGQSFYINNNPNTPLAPNVLKMNSLSPAPSR